MNYKSLILKLIKAKNITELNKLNKTLAKRANSRLLSLEKHELDYYAYDRANHFLLTTFGKTRFPSKIEDFDLLELSLKELDLFLSKESSTISGQKKILKRKLENFENIGISFKDTNEAKDFLKFLGNEDVREVLEYSGKSKYGGESEELVDNIKGAWEAPKGEEKILKIFEDWKQGKIYYDEIGEQLNAIIKSKKR